MEGSCVTCLRFDSCKLLVSKNMFSCQRPRHRSAPDSIDPATSKLDAKPSTPPTPPPPSHHHPPTTPHHPPTTHPGRPRSNQFRAQNEKLNKQIASQKSPSHSAKPTPEPRPLAAARAPTPPGPARPLLPFVQSQRPSQGGAPRLGPRLRIPQPVDIFAYRLLATVWHRITTKCRGHECSRPVLIKSLFGISRWGHNYFYLLQKTYESRV